jgi:protein-disulfide isomerase
VSDQLIYPNVYKRAAASKLDPSFGRLSNDRCLYSIANLRRIIFPQRLALARYASQWLVVILTMTQLTKAQQACPTFSLENQHRLEAYLDALYSVSSDEDPQKTPHNHITDSQDVNSLCYKRLSVVEDPSGTKHVFFLTPDQKFLTVALSDTNEDPRLARLVADEKTLELLVKDPSPSLGSTNAPLTMVVFIDLQCPYCRRLDNWISSLPGDLSTNIRIIYKQMPLDIHSWANQAAALALCASQQSSGAYLRLQKLMLDAQETLSSTNFAEVTRSMVDHASPIEAGPINDCLSHGTYQSTLLRDQTLARTLRVSTTPTIFVNGHRLNSLTSQAVLESQLRKALQQYQSNLAKVAVGAH